MDLLGSWPNNSRPFVTYYDVASGERTELSGTTTRNWVSKAANLLVDECDAEVGTRVQVELPTHWMRMVWLLATWVVGATVVDRAADIGIVGPDLGIDPPPAHYLATALHPLGLPFDEPPAGFIDLGRSLPAQPDAFFPVDAPSPDDAAVDLGGLRVTYADLQSLAAPTDARVARGQASLRDDIHDLVSIATGGGSLVLVTGGSPEQIRNVATQERASLR